MDHDGQRRKRLWLAYLLAVPFGCLGAHRFYLGSRRSGTGMMLLWGAGFLLAWAVAIVKPGQPSEAAWDSAAGLLMLSAWTWELVDLFLLPGMVRQANEAKVPPPPAAPSEDAD